MVLLSLAYFESGFRRDVDLGLGQFARGSGVDSCLMQIRVGSGATAEGWPHADLVGDRKKCFRAGLHLVRQSFHACRKLPREDWLGAYTSGTCRIKEPYSRQRMRRALTSPRPPVDDEIVFANPSAEPTPTHRAHVDLDETGVEGVS